MGFRNSILLKLSGQIDFDYNLVKRVSVSCFTNLFTNVAFDLLFFFMYYNKMCHLFIWI